MTPKEQVIINTIAAQRNELLNMIANLQGELFERDAQINELKNQLANSKVQPVSKKPIIKKE